MHLSAKLLPPAERAARVAEKRTKLLRFLRDELYTTAAIAGQLLGINSRQGVHTTLTSMERDQLVKRETVHLPMGHKITLWGITSHGQALAFDLATEKPIDRYFEPSRLGLTTLQHSLDLQMLRLQAEAAGWTGWTNGNNLGKMEKGKCRPDALAVDPPGVRWGIEVERNIKTHKRYTEILKDRLLAIKTGQIQKVLWLCSTKDQANRLKAILANVPETQDLAVLKKGLPPGSLIFSDYDHFKQSRMF